MAEYLFPGVYVEEIVGGVHPIEGVDTSTGVMVGVTELGPNALVKIKSFAEFTRKFGGPVVPAPDVCDKWTLDQQEGGHWWQFPLAVKGFFENGGQHLVIQRIPRDHPDELSVDDFVTAIQSLKEVDSPLCLAPGMWSAKIQKTLIEHCEARQNCFAILDPPPGLDLNGVLTFRRRINSSFAALYYPWLEVAGLNGQTTEIAPSGHLAGIYARVDGQRGVHAAPANEVIHGITKIAREVTTHDQESLNPAGINALRSFPGQGHRVWGARTLSRDPEWKYVNVRRLLIFLEESIRKGTQWVVFEPNGEPLWARVRQAVTNFLRTVWLAGALQGRTAEEAFFVKCDRTTMTQADIDQGRLIYLIGVAPIKPAEFVIFRIGQWTANYKD